MHTAGIKEVNIFFLALIILHMLQASLGTVMGVRSHLATLAM